MDLHLDELNEETFENWVEAREKVNNYTDFVNDALSRLHKIRIEAYESQAANFPREWQYGVLTFSHVLDLTTFKNKYIVASMIYWSRDGEEVWQDPNPISVKNLIMSRDELEDYYYEEAVQAKAEQAERQKFAEACRLANKQLRLKQLQGEIDKLKSELELTNE